MIGKMLSEYQKCINKIDDYLEYRYKFNTKEEMKEIIINYMNQLTNNLKNTNEKIYKEKSV